MRETWYVLDDGSAVDPREVVRSADGRLGDRNGVAVAMRGDVPMSRGVDPDEERAKAELAKQKRETPPIKKEEKAAPETTVVEETPEKTKAVEAEKPKGGYKTRETKAE